MAINKNVEKYLWITAVSFMSYLFLSSFIVSRNFLDLLYLIILYAVTFVIKLLNKK